MNVNQMNIKINKSISYVNGKEILDIDIFRKIGIEVYRKIRNYYPHLYNCFYETNISSQSSQLDIDLMILNADSLTLKKYLVLLTYDDKLDDIPLVIKRISMYSNTFPGKNIKREPLNTIYIIVIILLIAMIICIYLHLFGIIDELYKHTKQQNKFEYEYEFQE